MDGEEDVQADEVRLIILINNEKNNVIIVNKQRNCYQKQIFI